MDWSTRDVADALFARIIDARTRAVATVTCHNFRAAAAGALPTAIALNPIGASAAAETAYVASRLAAGVPTDLIFERATLRWDGAAIVVDTRAALQFQAVVNFLQFSARPIVYRTDAPLRVLSAAWPAWCGARVRFEGCDVHLLCEPRDFYDEPLFPGRVAELARALDGQVVVAASDGAAARAARVALCVHLRSDELRDLARWDERVAAIVPEPGWGGNQILAQMERVPADARPVIALSFLVELLQWWHTDHAAHIEGLVNAGRVVIVPSVDGITLEPAAAGDPGTYVPVPVAHAFL
jgi:hypothetical protein